MVTLKREWSQPSTILFATECPPNERNFTFALAQAKESRASLVLLHISGSETSLLRPPKQRTSDRAAVSSARKLLEPLAEHARELNIPCTVAVREGGTAEEILSFLRERKVDRIVIGARTAGPVGKLLVGSVAEALLRKAEIPVTIVSPYLASGTYRSFLTRTVLGVVTAHRSSDTVARFAAELAAHRGANLFLQYVIQPQECAREMAGRTPDQIECQLVEMVPARLRQKVKAQAMVTLGDPTEELLYQGRVLRASVIVMSAHNATHFAAVSNSCVLYKVLAYAHCPVITLSPVILADFGPMAEPVRLTEESYIAGVI